MIDWFGKLGIMGYPLTICSVLALMFVIERLVFFMGLPRPDDYNHPLQKILANNPKDDGDIKDEMYLYEKALNRHMGFIRLIGNISPLLGLLGTLIGMIQAFKDLAAHQGPVVPSILAGGLWQALLTTAFGLSVAVVCVTVGGVLTLWGNSHMSCLKASLNKRFRQQKSPKYNV
jgi:biopolymer transport protein ExbB/TolQ